MYAKPPPEGYVLATLVLLAVIVLLLALTGCSTANNWRPYVPPVETRHVQVCVQYGSKVYDRDTGEECLTREEQRRKERARCKTPVECAK